MWPLSGQPCKFDRDLHTIARGHNRTFFVRLVRHLMQRVPAVECAIMCTPIMHSTRSKHTEGLRILRYEIHVLLLRIFALPPHVMAWLASLCDSAAAYRDSRPQSQGLTRPKTPLGPASPRRPVELRVVRSWSANNSSRSLLI